jgi:hypothetical protein
MCVQSVVVIHFDSEKPYLVHEYRETFAPSIIRILPVDRPFTCGTRISVILDVLYFMQRKRPSTSVEMVEQIREKLTGSSLKSMRRASSYKGTVSVTKSCKITFETLCTVQKQVRLTLKPNVAV